MVRYEKQLRFAIAIGIKVLFILAILASVLNTYQEMVVNGNYVVLTTEQGPDTSDYEAP